MILRILVKCFSAVFLLTLIFGPAVNSAQAGDKLEGLFYLDSYNCEKGTANADCQINFQIAGDAAQAIYEKMKAKAVKEGCEGTALTKTDSSGVSCTLSDEKTYDCDFGYNFARKKLVHSSVSC
jgi:hypothetical protein